MLRFVPFAALFALLSIPFTGFSLALPSASDAAHPDHGAPFHEQLSGQWVIEGEDGEARRLRFYEDGRFAFQGESGWTAGSFFILRSDERSKGVLRLEYYLDGNLHFQEVRCEIHFEAHADHDGDHYHGDHAREDHDHDHGEEHHQDGDHDHGEAEGEHHHEMLLVESLPAAEQSLALDGDYEHVH